MKEQGLTSIITQLLSTMNIIMTNYNDYNTDDYTCSDNNTVTFDGVDINNNRTCSDNSAE